MVFDRLFGRFFQGASAELPTLYPGLDPLQLEQFLATEEFARIKEFENVYILPFVTKRGEPTQTRFGLGLARFLIRNLMLLRDVSIHGPEDTPVLPYEAIQAVRGSQPRSAHVTGVAHFDSHDFSLQVEVHHRTGQVESARICRENFQEFIYDCSATIASLFGSTVDDRIAAAWKVAQPRGPQSLVQLGRLHVELDRKQMAERGRLAQNLLRDDPDFVVPVWDFDEELPGAQKLYLPSLARDPHNAQLCFMTFLTIWKSKGPQPEAVQFCRKAIELSPGHGKAHMCAPHAAQQPASMLGHSELGYRLLPGNTFAMTNYTIALTRANAPIAQRLEVAEEGVAADPRDPGNYQWLIKLYTSVGDYRRALATAERLQHLFEPSMDERTRYCLRQNPRRAQLLDSGAYDPAAENRQRIAELRKRL